MDERDRIRRMVQDGKITQAEADRLLVVLAEIDEADQSLERSARTAEAEAEGAVAADPRPGATANAATTASASTTSHAHSTPNTDPHANDNSDADSRSATDPEWADDLRGALDAAGRAASQAVAGVGRAVSEVGKAVFGEDPGAAAGASAAGEVRSPDSDIAPPGTRWMHVNLMAVELDVQADASVTEPVLAGDVERVRLEPTPDGFQISSRGSERASERGKFLPNFGKIELQLRLPSEVGLDVRVTAGELTLEGVPYLRGKVTAGEVRAKGLRGIDFATSAGDVDVEVQPRAGHHRLHASAADVKVRFSPASDVRVAGTVSIGDASVSGTGLQSERRGLGCRIDGVLGSGIAQFDLKVTTGDVSLKASSPKANDG